MKKIMLSALLLISVCTHAQTECSDTFSFETDVEEGVTPYTNLEINNHPCQFQFAIVTDRTGGHRPGVFMDGVNKLNLLQPEFVMSVGDLIEGYTLDTVELKRQWDEFDSFVEQLQMPFFYLPGNHDITNGVMEKVWKERFGPTYYHFVYKDVLFLCLNSEDQVRGAGHGTISDSQFNYVKKVLDENNQVKWTLVFLHQPLWHQKDTERWNDLEALLKNRNHTVFAGHEHSYVKEARNDGKYFTLATTGGGSSLRGPELGEFDHVMWVTMTDRGPIMANLQLQGIWSEDVVTEDTKELIDKMSARSPIEIEPLIIKGEKFQSGTFEMTIINDENIPMQVELSAENSSDLALFLPTNSVMVPPNNRKTLKLQLQSRDGKWETPALLKARVNLKSENEPAKLSYPYRFNLRPIPYRKLEKATAPKIIDGQLNDWKALPYSFERDNGQVKVQFDVRYDEQFLYMAARVTDDMVVSTGEGAAWVQDNIAFGFNAEKSSRSAMSVGRSWYKYEFLQLITPEYEGVSSVLYRKMPEGSLVKCVKTASGYDAEIAVPLSYIEEKQGKNWKSIRVNIGVDDRDEGGEVNRYGWQPLWRNADNVVGSGLFWRN